MLWYDSIQTWQKVEFFTAKIAQASKMSCTLFSFKIAFPPLIGFSEPNYSRKITMEADIYQHEEAP